MRILAFDGVGCLIVLIVELKFLVIEFNGLGSSASSLGHNSLEGIYSTS